jgi:hypothetical protein
VRASRVRRREREHRRRTVELLVAVVVAAGGIAYATTQADNVVDDPGPSGSPSDGEPSGTPGLVVMNVTGGSRPLLAVVGGGVGSSAAMALPFGMTFVVPGEGEVKTDRIADLAGSSLQVAVSNTLGTWVDHYAVTDLLRLEGLVDRVGGLDVVLPGATTIGEEVLGPGGTTMTGAQVRAYLGEPDANTFTRWEIVLAGILASPPDLVEADLSETDGPEAVQGVLEHARGADLETFPVEVVTALVRVPDFKALDVVMFGSFGVMSTPVAVIVQNGSGVPAVGESVARRLIPRGFRVVLSQNAPGFDHPRTQIVALGDVNVPAARRARAALGVGRVAVSQVPSGIGSVIIRVGKDFTA